MSNRPLITPTLTATVGQVEDIIGVNDVDSSINQAGIKAFVDEDYVGDIIGMQLVAYAAVNPNKISNGEYSYRSGNRRGIKIFYSAITHRVTVERSDAGGDDWIGTNAWMPTDGWIVKPYFNMLGNSGEEMIKTIAWTANPSPNTVMGGYYSFNWVTMSGSQITISPTGNDNGILHFEVWKPKT